MRFTSSVMTTRLRTARASGTTFTLKIWPMRHIAALEADKDLSGCYNLGTGRGHSVREVIDTARRVTGREIPEVASSAPPRRSARTRRRPDVDHRTNSAGVLGHDLESAIRSAWEFKQNRQAGA